VEAMMKLSEKIKPISYLKSNAAEVLKTVNADKESYIITQNGEAKAVLMDIDAYEETQETMALLKILALGNKEINNGEVRSSSDVFANIRNRNK